MHHETQLAVGYVRVSTQRQGESGLGLEAQHFAIRAYCNHHGLTLVQTYEEIESGKNNERPALASAVAACRQKPKAVLVIAKLDRLARNVAFISSLMESDVDFVCCDIPEANRLLLHIMAAVAENEAMAISRRTKEALAASKARGTKLGAANPASQNLNDDARRRGAAASGELQRRAAADFYAPIVPIVRRERDAGTSFDRIAVLLNNLDYKTRMGCAFTGPLVRRILDRAPGI